jgi:hypothetical protein
MGGVVIAVFATDQSGRLEVTIFALILAYREHPFEFFSG